MFHVIRMYVCPDNEREDSPNKCHNLVTYDPITTYKKLQSMWIRTKCWVSNQVTQLPCRCERNTRTKLLKAGGQEKNFRSFRGVKEPLWRKELRSFTTSGLLDHPWLQGYSETRQGSANNIRKDKNPNYQSWIDIVSSGKILLRKKKPFLPKRHLSKAERICPL